MMRMIARNLSSLGSLSIQDHFRYWILPFSVSMLLLFMFCFGSAWMVEIVSPLSNREYGALENIQAALLVVAMVMAVKGFFVSRVVIQRVFFGVAALALLFMFLEEIDYGLHFTDLIFNVPPEKRAVFRNVHASGTWKTILMKKTMYAFIMVVCILLPVINGQWIPAIIRQFIPSVKMIYTAATLQVVSSIASHFVYTLNLHANASLDENVAEFGEGIIYYLLLLYMLEIYRRVKDEQADVLMQAK